MQIELLTSRTAHENLGDLIELLQDAVDSGASVGFLPSLPREAASDYWRSVLPDLDARHRLLLGAMATLLERLVRVRWSGGAAASR